MFVNYDMPTHAEEYVQHIGWIGCAGVDGHACACAFFVTLPDARLAASWVCSGMLARQSPFNCSRWQRPWEAFTVNGTEIRQLNFTWSQSLNLAIEGRC
jgi:hypothetical protein